MKFAFGKAMAAAAAAGLMGVACGGSSPEAQAPEVVPTEEAPADPSVDPAAAPTGDTAAAEGKACCKGMNECQGKGNCKAEGGHECAGKNECKGKGGCNAHCPK